jgi:DNA polymerase-3 subunit beta
MKVSINRETLLHILEKTVGAIEKKTTSPILSNVLLHCSEKGLRVNATDLDVEMVGYLGNTGVEEPGSVTVSARKILDICKSLPPESILSIKTRDSKLIIESTRSHFELATLPPDDFPVLDNIAFDHSFSVSEKILFDVINKTAYAMAIQDVRYYLNGMLIDLSASKICCVATDGHRLAYSETNTFDTGIKDDISFIIPRKGIQEFLRMLSSDSDVSLDLEFSSNHIRLTKDNLRFTSKLIDGKYPDYRSAMPMNSKYSIELDRVKFKNTLSRVAILSNEKFRGVLLRLSDGTLELRSNNPEQEMAKESLDINFSGDPLEVGFNASYLLDAVNHLQDDSFIIEINAPESSTLIRPVDNKNTRYVVMPVRL